MKYTVALIVIVLLIAIGYLAYSIFQSNQFEPIKSEDSMMKTDSIMESSDEKEMMKDQSSSSSGESMMDQKMSPGRYVEYSKAALDAGADQKRVLFFYASWCPTCRPADADFKTNQSRIPAGVTVIRVNYNDPETDSEEKALAQKYGVTYQHTYVQIDDQGNQVTKWNGGKLAELLSNLK